jgi:tellurite resistance protein TerC
MTALWIGMFALVCALVAVDLWLLRPLRTRISDGRSVAYGAFYLVLGMAFNVAVFFLYEHHALGAGLDRGYAMIAEGVGGGGAVIDGPEATLQYLASYTVAIVLGLDSVFVFAAVFDHLRVKERQKHRILMWGVVLAVLVRLAMVFGFGEFIHRFEWFRFVLAFFLLLAAIRMVLVRKENVDPEKNVFVRVLRRVMPARQVSGGRAFAALVVPLLLIETADAFLAFDSVPAGYAFTREPFLIFSGACFALLCVRSMAPALTALLHRLRYFKLGLAMILVYTAIMVARRTSVVQDVLASADVRPVDLDMLRKLAFVGGAIIIGVLAAAFLGAEAKPGAVVSSVSPLGEDADRIARQALTTARKVGVGLIGVTGLGLGAFMAVGPGPGIPIVLGSLLLLGTEFAIAKRLVDKYRPRAEAATMAAAEQTRKRFSPWALCALIALTIGLGVVIHFYGHLAVNAVARGVVGRDVMEKKVAVGLVLSALLPMVAGQVLLGYLAFIYRRSPAPPERAP